MASPFAFAEGTATSSSSSATLSVTTPTRAGDALAVITGVGGSTTPGLSSVTDTQGNAYSPVGFITGVVPQLWVYAATGNTTALTTSDSITVTLSANPSGGWAVIGADLPGVATVDVSQAAYASSASPSVSGSPAFAGETALVAFAWANTGGSGTLAAPFTGFAQVHASTGTWLTVASELNLAAEPVTASAAITSASWRAILLTFESTASPDLPQINPGPTWLAQFKPGLPGSRPLVPPPVSPPPPVLITGSLAAAGMGLAGNVAAEAPLHDPVAISPGPTWSALFKPGQPRPKLLVPLRAQPQPAAGTVFPPPDDLLEINPGPTWMAQFKPGMPKPRSYPPESRILPLVLLHGSLAMSRMALSGTAAVDSTPGANSPRQVWRTPDRVHRSGATMQ